MGTSQRHSPSVTGDPNWGQSSQAITQTAKDVVELESLSSLENLSNSQVKRIGLLDKRIHRNISKAISRLVKASGGKDNVIGGKSNSFGKRGISYGIGLYDVFRSISEKGLSAWLESKGYDLRSYNTSEILDLLFDYICEPGTTLEDTAANDALRLLFRKIENEALKLGISLEELLKRQPGLDRIRDYIDDFFGNYIYSHISQNFTEKLEKEYGIKMTKQIKKEIRRTIIEDVKAGINGKKVSEIDWKGTEGREFIKKEFSTILKILTPDD